jgi:hypothetical protein
MAVFKNTASKFRPIPNTGAPGDIIDDKVDLRSSLQRWSERKKNAEVTRITQTRDSRQCRALVCLHFLMISIPMKKRSASPMPWGFITGRVILLTLDVFDVDDDDVIPLGRQGICLTVAQ